MSNLTGAIRTALTEFLEKEGDRIVKELQESFKRNNRVATGKTAKSIESTVKGNSLIIDGNSNIKFLVNGRGPTRGGRTGNATWIEDLKDWLRARNLDDNLLWPIWNKIHKEGFKGTPNLISDVLNDQLVDQLTDKVADITFDESLKQLDRTIEAFEDVNSN